MDARYRIRDTSMIYSPALLFYKDILRQNIARCIERAGSPERLRPHVKTHKTREIVFMELEAGIYKHKCATLVEAELLASCGVEDVLLAYPIVGPNCGRLATLLQAYPACRFMVLADHPRGVEQLSQAMTRVEQTVGVLLDLDVGQHRTGIAPGPEARALYERICSTPGLTAQGFHVYDGHNHQENPAERVAAVQALLQPVLALRRELEQRGCPVPTLVVGGTPTFPMFAELDYPGFECSPGTCILQDHGYGTHFPDMSDFLPAALLLTRVISKPAAQQLTLDLGYKALASDPPAGERCVLLNVPEYRFVLQNEEHLVVTTPAAAQFQPGDDVYAIPTHICPTCAVHDQAWIIEDQRLTETWAIAARGRQLALELG